MISRLILHLQYTRILRNSSLAVLCVSLSLCLAVAHANESTSMIAGPTKDGYVPLSQGDHFTNWKHNGNWKINSGVISRQGKGGALVYVGEKIPDNFDLRFDWKVGTGSNSGIYYRPTQYEYQILDNTVHADGKNPRTSAASLYFCIQTLERHNEAHWGMEYRPHCV